MSKPKPYAWNNEVLHMLSDALRTKYLGVKLEIVDIYILHAPEYSPKLIVKAQMPDGTVMRTDMLFFEDAE